MRQYAKLKRENVLTVNMQQRDFTVKFVLKGGTATQRKSPKHISISTENHSMEFAIFHTLITSYVLFFDDCYYKLFEQQHTESILIVALGVFGSYCSNVSLIW